MICRFVKTTFNRPVMNNIPTRRKGLDIVPVRLPVTITAIVTTTSIDPRMILGSTFRLQCKHPSPVE